MATRLPTPGGDDGQWGQILNDFLSQAHNTDGSLKPLTQSQVQNLTADLAAKYTKPAGGVPTADLADDAVTDVKVSAGAAISADKLADGTTNKLLTAAERAKLAGVASGATANATDAQLRDRGTHTGTQTASTISDFTAAVVAAPVGTATQTALGGKLDKAAAPAGYIRVPGNSQFGTSDFYVMKYQAKNDGANNAVSTAAGTPWVNISQRDAIDTSLALGNGYHLVTEAEWMTIATNAMYVASNWTGGTVGTGALYRQRAQRQRAAQRSRCQRRRHRWLLRHGQHHRQ